MRPISAVSVASLHSNLARDVREAGHYAQNLLAVTGNTETVALEFLVAQKLVTLAQARLKAATDAAIACSVLGDYTTDPLPTGEHTCYSGDVVAVDVSVRRSVDQLNPTKLRTSLQLAGVASKVLDHAWKAATKARRGAHVIQPRLVMSEEAPQ